MSEKLPFDQDAFRDGLSTERGRNALGVTPVGAGNRHPVVCKSALARRQVPVSARARLPHRSGFFSGAAPLNAGEASGVAVNSEGHIFLFQRVAPMLAEYDQSGRFLRSMGEGLFTHPHGLRIDRDDNVWTTDDDNHLVLKLSPEGRVLLVLGRRNMAAEADWLFNQPTDVAFGRNGEIYVADGYGNSRVVKFDRTGKFIKAWGTYGTGPGEFNLPHSIAVDARGRVYVGDRENRRIQIFDDDGQFLTPVDRRGLSLRIDDYARSARLDG